MNTRTVHSIHATVGAAASLTFAFLAGDWFSDAPPVEPSTSALAELAALAGMDERLFADFEPGDFEDLTKDLGLSVPVRVQMRKLFKALRERAVVVTAQAKFQQFLQLGFLVL